MKSRNAEMKNSTKGKKTTKESVGNMIFFDGLVKPDDQLVLSPDVRFKTFIHLYDEFMDI